jgi:hypothetical protein
VKWEEEPNNQSAGYEDYREVERRQEKQSHKLHTCGPHAIAYKRRAELNLFLSFSISGGIDPVSPFMSGRVMDTV